MINRDRGPLAHVRHVLTLARDIVPPMHPAGRPFVLAAAVLTVLLRRWRPLGLLAGIVTAWCAWFFREPRRTPPSREGVVVSAADGTVAAVDEAHPPEELELGNGRMPRVSIFLSIFDVHVQRIPVTSRVVNTAYRAGKFLSADLDKASEDNERNSVQLRTANGHDVVVVQIAGLVARRIVSSATPEAYVTIAATYGLIRFGSRVDVYLPPGSRVVVERGQRAIGGETVLAELPAVRRAPDLSTSEHSSAPGRSPRSEE